MQAPDPAHLGLHGELVPGPPWIFGLRGTPREAPENTLASLRAALALGLDGIAYDVRACASGDFVLCADARLERTSDAVGELRERTPAELARVDAGGWFSRAFAGERLAFIEEALELPGNAAGSHPQQLVILREPAALPALARALAEHARRLSVRVASDHRAACLEARDLGLAPLLIAPRADEAERRFVSHEHLSAVGARFAAWNSHVGRQDWPCERFAIDVDDPDELLAACRQPVNALVTTEPRRALAVRALAALTRGDTGPYPLQVEPLLVEREHSLGGLGEWCGAWQVGARLRNPFAFPVRAALEVVVRRGAFEVDGCPEPFELAPGAELAFSFALRGGSWSPGGDPLLFVQLSTVDAPRPFLALDAPLRRRRHLRLSDDPTRLSLLRESPGDPPASVTVRRQRGDLLVALESPGNLEAARLLVHLDGDLFAAPRGLRLPLPRDLARPGGLPFSVGIEGLRSTRRGPVTALRRWAGGVPDTMAAGEPGRLLP